MRLLLAATQANTQATASPPTDKEQALNEGSPAQDVPRENDRDVEKQSDDSPVEDLPPPYSIHSTWTKRFIVLAATASAFFSPLTAQIYLPALNDIAKDLHVTSAQINLTITTYMVFQGIVPMFIGSLADSGGRRPGYMVCFIIYIAANIGVALAPSYSAVLGLRCLQSAGSSSTVALCTAVVADVVTSAERGQYIGFTVVPMVLAPALGPVIGGLLTQYLGWRSIFWFLAITSAVTVLLLAVFFPETCRHIVGDGSIKPPRMYQSVWQILNHRRLQKKQDESGLSRQTSTTSSAAAKFKFKMPNVLGSLFMLFEKGTGLLLGTSSLIFAGFYAIMAAIPTIFHDVYKLNDTEVGLMYLPLAFGSVVAACVIGPLINGNYKRHCIKQGIPYDRVRQQDLSEFPIERARLEIGIPMLLLGGLSTIAWGWALQARTHIAGPCILSAILGIGMIGLTNTTNVLLSDMHPGRVGTATAANNFTRCLLGAGSTAAIVPLMGAIGTGWAFTLVGALYLICIGLLLLLVRYGKRWRAELKAKNERKKEKAASVEANTALEEGDKETRPT